MLYFPTNKTCNDKMRFKRRDLIFNLLPIVVANWSNLLNKKSLIVPHIARTKVLTNLQLGIDLNSCFHLTSIYGLTRHWSLFIVQLHANYPQLIGLSSTLLSSHVGFECGIAFVCKLSL